MAWKNVSLRTNNRTLFGAWDALNKAIAALAATIPAPSPPPADANLVPVTNGTLNPIADGTLLMMAGDGEVQTATGAWNALCVGAAEGVIPASAAGQMRKGGLKSIPMVEGLVGLEVGQPVSASMAAPGAGTTGAGDAQGLPIAVVFDTTPYTEEGGWRCIVEILLTASRGLDPN